MNTENKKVVAEFTSAEFLKLLERDDIRTKIQENAIIKVITSEAVLKSESVQTVSSESILKSEKIRAEPAEKKLKSEVIEAGSVENMLKNGATESASIENPSKSICCAGTGLNPQKDVDMMNEVTDLLHAFNMKPHINGYRYIRSAILLAIDDPEVLESISTILYPTIAKQYNTTPSRAARGIRHAVQSTLNRENVDKIEEVLGHPLISKMTNSEFIAATADYLSVKFRIGEFFSDHNVNMCAESDIVSIVTNLLRSLAVPPHLKGYNYIRSSILLAIEYPEILQSIVGVLYPKIAKQYKTTPSRVERAIRHAIECAWDRGFFENIDKVFGYSISTEKGRPTNAEFLACITDYLILNYEI